MSLVGNVHLIAGSSEDVPEILAMLEEEGIEMEGNPDIDVRTYPQFLVADARALCERASAKAFRGRRVFITVTPNLTYEAQNTLLKTLEEPPGNALFFFVVPAPEALLPTVRSRAHTLALDATTQVAKVDATVFLKAQPQKRLDMLKPLLDKGDDDVRDISHIVTFLSSLERILAGRPGERDAIEAVYRARKYATDKGSLLKALLEQVALLAPVLQ